MVEGPLFVAEHYELERERVAPADVPKVMGAHVCNAAGSERVVALLLLNLASLKDSYAPYAAEDAALYERERSGG